MMLGFSYTPPAVLFFIPLSLSSLLVRDLLPSRKPVHSPRMTCEVRFPFPSTFPSGLSLCKKQKAPGLVASFEGTTLSPVSSCPSVFFCKFSNILKLVPDLLRLFPLPCDLFPVRALRPVPANRRPVKSIRPFFPLSTLFHPPNGLSFRPVGVTLVEAFLFIFLSPLSIDELPRDRGTGRFQWVLASGPLIFPP